MDSLQINVGIRLAINDDPERVITFNPSDVVFAEKFYALMGEFQERLSKYQAETSAFNDEAVDSSGIPMDTQKRVTLVREVCEYIREKIDYLFGAGTSQKAFGDALDLDAFMQFFDGITPYIQKARANKVAKYTKK